MHSMGGESAPPPPPPEKQTVGNSRNFPRRHMSTGRTLTMLLNRNFIHQKVWLHVHCPSSIQTAATKGSSILQTIHVIKAVILSAETSGNLVQKDPLAQVKFMETHHLMLRLTA
ncbi:uncharacterized protein LOC112540935 isoform X2 [Python bivittatus]|uniref:Uncharacterized protein LOC112540935 isoform X2 n=1 Tax=Python bivittatus TaxID=176946 RepID=A0A9F5MSA0_PYTBI|nr:uncharacterized protein LOC112540935 isoform X2 [Python bivittatus]